MAVGEKAKINAAREALKLVEDKTTIGIGTGSTSSEFIKLLAEKARNEKLKIECVSTSSKSTLLAQSLGLEIVEFEEVEEIDLAVDGADQIDPQLNLVKGWGGGAIYQEKRVDYKAKKFVVIADEAKLVQKLHGNVPVEVEKEKAEEVMEEMDEMGALSAKFREQNGKKFVTDNGNYILDVEFREVKNPVELEQQLSKVDGVFENGVFTKNVFKAIIGTEDGVKVINKK
ncbi:ribose-5-phosphate isomerase RpiA [Candidatus Micrarchaeota archaeon]|nr:ribose-5-phosphate isomerase RpiA [Candidatus Micrarchaeota archaeon]